MTTPRVALVTLALAAGLLLAMAMPAAAGDCAGTSSLGDDTGEVAAWCAEADPGSNGSPMSSLWAMYCEPQGFGEWDPARSVEFFQEAIATGDVLYPLNGDPDIEYGLYVVFCHMGDGNYGQWDTLIWELTPPLDPTALRDDVAARIEVPTPSFGASPAFGSVPAIVGLDTWLWLTDPWEPITASETDGGVSAIVTATPQRVTWDFGADGTTVCHDAGTVWTATIDPDTAPSCVHRFSRASVDQADLAYRSTVTVTWQFRWWLNGIDQGPFGTTDATSGFAVPVGEIQAIETHTP